MKTHEILYQTLSQAQDYVNGEQLAQEMGLSRTSIWKAIQRLEKEGLIKSQASLVARFSFSLEEAEQQKKNATFFELAKICDQFIERCQSNLNRAYLEVTRLVSLADDKEKQSQAFRLMELALEEQLRLSRSQQLLEKLGLARTMWKANVSFQNALEYMVLSLES